MLDSSASITAVAPVGQKLYPLQQLLVHSIHRCWHYAQFWSLRVRLASCHRRFLCLLLSVFVDQVQYAPLSTPNSPWNMLYSQRSILTCSICPQNRSVQSSGEQAIESAAPSHKPFGSIVCGAFIHPPEHRSSSTQGILLDSPLLCPPRLLPAWQTPSLADKLAEIFR